MKNIIAFLISFLVVLTLGWFLVDTDSIQAGSEHNTSGYIWSENIGWISLNSDTGGGSNYGVNIDETTGDLSGHAWSENIGWISFNRSDTGDPPSNPFESGTPIANYDSNNDRITGWMRVLNYSGGWDGWIRFCENSICSSDVTIDDNGEWHGWAWSDGVVGWLSFNSDEGGGSDYGAVSEGIANQPPTVSDLDVIGQDYCDLPKHYFSWTYDDEDPQTRFDLEIDSDGDFSPSDITISENGSASSYPITVPSPPISGKLEYNTTYYWRIKVYDDESDSGWVYYGDTPTMPGNTFTTESHRYPNVDFSWDPSNPSIDEETMFTDETTVYGGATISSWFWVFPDGTPATSGDQNPTVEFSFVGDKTIILQVTDSSNYTCSGSLPLNVNPELPVWKEK